MSVRLRQLADDCEEKARRSICGDARSLYHLAARDARQGAAARYLSDAERGEILAAASALATVARLYDGEPVFGAMQEPAAKHEPAAVRPPIESLLGPRQLAQQFGMSERGARKAIERGMRRGLAGFHRDGALWFAEPEAFAQVRR